MNGASLDARVLICIRRTTVPPNFEMAFRSEMSLLHPFQDASQAEAGADELALLLRSRALMVAEQGSRRGPGVTERLDEQLRPRPGSVARSMAGRLHVSSSASHGR